VIPRKTKQRQDIGHAKCGNFMTLSKRWKKHLSENNMTYREHWRFAVSHGLVCLEAGLFLIIHGFFPCFLEHTGSLLVRKLKKSFDLHKKEIERCKSKL
jgi:hypothetical protein